MKQRLHRGLRALQVVEGLEERHHPQRRRDAGVLLPDEAVGADQNRRIVYVVDEAGKVSAKPVRTGPRIDGYRVIREGLTGDELVVINGLLRVRPGVTVKPEVVTLPPVAENAGLSQ